MKRILLTLVLLAGFLFQGNAQRINYETSSPYFVGLNFGHTWHTSDVRNVDMEDYFSWGAGIIAGRTFNRNYGKRLAFDLRFRYLYGGWHGLDRDTTSFLENNTAFQPLFESEGYAVQNFKSIQHSLDLELAIHFNRFTERTRADPYIFGGIGAVGTRTKGAELINPDVNINGLKFPIPLDKNGDGDGYSENAFDVNFLPSVGVGLGIYLSNRFSIGIEHRTTFFMGDYFDGTNINKNGEASKPFVNDLYHYTNVYLRWYLKNKDSKKTKKPKTDTSEYDDTPVRSNPPIVNFTRPSSSNTSTESSIYNLQANLKNVDNPNDISFVFNGRQVTNFIFNPVNERFEITVTLEEGVNSFVITGINQDGSDSDQTVIIRETHNVVNPPIVNIVDPATSPYTVNVDNYTVKATIHNVLGKNNLNVTFNGQPLSNFSFTPNGDFNFSANVNLNVGTNVLNIVGYNEVGSAADQAVIIYNKRTPDTGNPPIVNITVPSVSPHTTNIPSQVVYANIYNVDDKGQIQVKLNGVKTSDFTYDSSTKQVQFNANLTKGMNVVNITAINSYGSDYSDVQINYEETVEIPAPIVDITVPNSNPYTTSNLIENIKASVLNVTNKNQIEVKINGVNITNFVYNSGMNMVQFDAELQNGSNIITIIATNNVGADSDYVQINFNRVVNPPVVNILTPNNNAIVTTPNQNVVASVLNVSSKNQIEVKVNNVNTNNFTYNGNNNTISLNTVLVEGTNSVMVRATNNDGTASDEITVYYKKEIIEHLPIVNITNPVNNPHTTFNNQENIKATVLNVSNKNQINVRINGSSVDFTFSGSTVQFVADLQLGNNTVTVNATNSAGIASDQRQILYKKAPVPPVVNITSPSTSPTVVLEIAQTIVAEVQNVESKNQIEVYFNNNEVSNFTYNVITKQVSFNVELVAGLNSITVVATNEAGTDSDNAQISLRIPIKDPPPEVNITTPSSSPHQTSNSNENIVASVLNVNNKNQIDVQINDVNTSNFTYLPHTNTVQFSAELQEGNNTIRISATNPEGTANDEVQIIYRRIITPPTVNITTPNSSQSTVAEPTQTIIADVQNIDNKNQIEVRVNDVITTNFSFNNSTKKVQLSTQLVPGVNSVNIKVANIDGEDSDQVQIVYRKSSTEGDDSNTSSGFAPSITINVPVADPHNTNSSTETVIAKVNAVTSKQNIQVSVNGLSNIEFTYNAMTKLVQFIAPLNVGNNTVKIEATNTFGNAVKQITIVRSQPEPATPKPPTVVFTTPKNPGLSVSESKYTIKAKVTNIEIKDGIKVIVNGKTINNNLVQFSPKTGEVEYTTDLIIGTNNFVIIATNKDGSKQASTNLKFERKLSGDININGPKVPCKDHPNLKFTNPKGSPSIVEIDNYPLTASLTNISNKNQIKIYLNGKQLFDFNFNPTSKVLQHIIPLIEGANLYKVVLSNDCSSREFQTIINYVDKSCGVEIEVLKTSELCIITPSGTYNVEQFMANPSFVYKGPATDLYFKATNNGKARVANNSFALNKNTFYKFKGDLMIEIKRVNNKWVLCVESSHAPEFGTGKNKPSNPCSLNLNPNANDNKKGSTKKSELDLPNQKGQDNKESTPASPDIKGSPNPENKTPTRTPGRR